MPNKRREEFENYQPDDRSFLDRFSEKFAREDSNVEDVGIKDVLNNIRYAAEAGWDTLKEHLSKEQRAKVIAEAQAQANLTNQDINTVLKSDNFWDKLPTILSGGSAVNALEAMEQYNQPTDNRTYDELLKEEQENDPESYVTPRLKAALSRFSNKMTGNMNEDRKNKLLSAAKIVYPDRDLTLEQAANDLKVWQEVDSMEQAEGIAQTAVGINKVSQSAARKLLDRLAKNPRKTYNEAISDYGPDVNRMLFGQALADTRGIKLPKNISSDEQLINALKEQQIYDIPTQYYKSGEKIMSPEGKLILNPVAEKNAHGLFGEKGIQIEANKLDNPYALQKSVGTLGHESRHAVDAATDLNKYNDTKIYYDPSSSLIKERLSPKEVEKYSKYSDDVDLKRTNIGSSTPEDAKSSYIRSLLEGKSDLDQYDKLNLATGEHFLNQPSNYELDAAQKLWKGDIKPTELYPELKKILKYQK